jgi:hypothetical protein
MGGIAYRQQFTRVQCLFQTSQAGFQGHPEFIEDFTEQLRVIPQFVLDHSLIQNGQRFLRRSARVSAALAQVQLAAETVLQAPRSNARWRQRLAQPFLQKLLQRLQLQLAAIHVRHVDVAQNQVWLTINSWSSTTSTVNPDQFDTAMSVPSPFPKSGTWLTHLPGLRNQGQSFCGSCRYYR